MNHYKYSDMKDTIKKVSFFILPEFKCLGINYFYLDEKAKAK